MQNRAIRRYLNKKVIHKRLKLLKTLEKPSLKDSNGETYYERMKKEPGRLRDKHPYDCGKSNCLCCHYEKVLSKKSLKEKRDAAFIKTQLVDNEFLNKPLTK